MLAVPLQYQFCRYRRIPLLVFHSRYSILLFLQAPFCPPCSYPCFILWKCSLTSLLLPCHVSIIYHALFICQGMPGPWYRPILHATDATYPHLNASYWFIIDTGKRILYNRSAKTLQNTTWSDYRRRDHNEEKTIYIIDNRCYAHLCGSNAAGTGCWQER